MLGPFHSSGPAVNALPGALPVDYPQEWIPGGRLSLTQGTARTTTDVSSGGTIYYEPDQHNRIPIFDGTKLRLVSFSPSTISLALAISSGSNYDVFAWWDGYRVRLSLSAAWTNATTRANALTTLPDQHGRIKVNSVAIVGASPLCATWLGFIRGSGANVCDDAVTKRLVCNGYNRIPRKLFTCPGYTDDNALTTYTATNTSWAAANGGTGSQLAFLAMQGDLMPFLACAQGTHSGATSRAVSVSQLDSTTDGLVQGISSNVTAVQAMNARYDHVISGDSYHTVDILLRAGGATATWHADAARNGATADPPATYITGWSFG